MASPGSKVPRTTQFGTSARNTLKLVNTLTLPCNKSAFAFLSFSASDGVGVKIGETGDGAMASSSEPSESESKEIAEFFDSGRDISQF